MALCWFSLLLTQTRCWTNSRIGDAWDAMNFTSFNAVSLGKISFLPVLHYRDFYWLPLQRLPQAINFVNSQSPHSSYVNEPQHEARQTIERTEGIEQYSDAIMSPMASQISSFTTVYSTVYSSADQRKHQSSASPAFVRGIHRWPVNSPHKGTVMRKMFPFDNVFMVIAYHSCHNITILLPQYSQ